jgi:hypothetical protein
MEEGIALLEQPGGADKAILETEAHPETPRHGRSKRLCTVPGKLH